MVRLLGFVAVAGTIFVLIHVYIWWRLVRGTMSSRRRRWAGGVAVAVLALLVPVSFFGERAAHWLAWPGYLWLALMFYLLLILAVVELPRLFAGILLTKADRGTGVPDEQRRLLLARGAAIFAGLTAAGLTGYGVATATGPPQVKRVRIPLGRLDRRMDGYRIALVSDIHIGPMRGRAHTERIVAMANRLDADLIAIVGDLVDGNVAEFGAAAAPLRDLRARRGSYFVTGNHEYYSGYQQWVDEVARLGVRPLRNERVELGGIDLAGVNDLTGEEYEDAPDLGRALNGRDTARPVILLAHQPIQVHEAARHGVDLQLSGHTHGGQMFPFHLLVRLQQPVVSGLATVDGTRLYVTNGAGFWGPPVRVGAPPAIALVELRAT
jgi:uncharacterized protein